MIRSPFIKDLQMRILKEVEVLLIKKFEAALDNRMRSPRATDHLKLIRHQARFSQVCSKLAIHHKNSKVLNLQTRGDQSI